MDDPANRAGRRRWSLVLCAAAVVGITAAGCGEPGTVGGILTVDADGCVFADAGVVRPRPVPLALPRGWAVQEDPVAIVSADGAVVVRLGEAVNGAGARFPWESGPILCPIESADPVRFRDIDPGEGTG